MTERRVADARCGPAAPRAAPAPCAILDFPEPDAPPGGLRFADPVDRVVAERLDEVRPALQAVERAAADGLYAVGYVAYEAAAAFDPALVTHPPGRLPLLWFGLFRTPVTSTSSESALDANDPCPPRTGAAARGVDAVGAAVESGGSFRLSTWTPSVDRARYDADIAAIREAIARGETYQVNHTLRLRARFEGDPLAFHRRLLAAQPGAFGAYLDLGRYRILSASPELFFRRRGRLVTTRPMKGTARRGRWLEEDRAAERELAASEKDRAENLMIVDLLRNDLGRIARVGTVRVPRLFVVERYPTVFQMTSTVTAEAAQDTSLVSLFEALFPCGSVTGAPKVATMRRIAALEGEPREVYCGAIGLVRPGGDCTFNVAIRTLWLDAATGLAEYGVGSGITWDSTPEGEYDEALAKAALLTRETPAFELLETLRLEDGACIRVERHLARLQASAAYFGWPDPGDAARAALLRHAAVHGTGTRRVRLRLAATGEVHVQSEPFAHDVVAEPLPVALARTAVSRQDVFLYHKTTHRAAYEARRAERPDVLDVLLQNEDGELTEFTRGNLVVALGGALWTPPRDCGLLAGTFRDELLERGEIRERVLRPEDLRRAEAVWFVNSLREWVPVRVQA